MAKKGDYVKSLMPFDTTIHIGQYLIIESVFNIGTDNYYKLKNIDGFYNDIFFVIITKINLRKIKINKLLNNK